jgi:hypothetical protein
METTPTVAYSDLTDGIKGAAQVVDLVPNWTLIYTLLRDPQTEAYRISGQLINIADATKITLKVMVGEDNNPTVEDNAMVKKHIAEHFDSIMEQSRYVLNEYVGLLAMSDIFDVCS